MIFGSCGCSSLGFCYDENGSRGNVDNRRAGDANIRIKVPVVPTVAQLQGAASEVRDVECWHGKTQVSGPNLFTRVRIESVNVVLFGCHIQYIPNRPTLEFQI